MNIQVVRRFGRYIDELFIVFFLMSLQLIIREKVYLYMCRLKEKNSVNIEYDYFFQDKCDGNKVNFLKFFL